MKKRLWLIGGIAAAMAGPASATLLAEESFIYDPGSIVGANGGTGWAEKWDPQNDSPYPVLSGSLSYGGLLTAGNSLGGGYAWSSIGRRLDSKWQGPFESAGLVSDPWTAGLIDQGVVYTSALVKRMKNEDYELHFGKSNISWFDQGSVKVTAAGGNWNLVVNGNSVSSGVAANLNETYLIVVKHTFGTGTVNLWVNPTLGGSDPAGGVSATGTDLGFKAIRTYLGNGDGAGVIDEIRLGTDYAGVTPVPEPATIAGLALGAALLRSRRRK